MKEGNEKGKINGDKTAQRHKHKKPLADLTWGEKYTINIRKMKLKS